MKPATVDQPSAAPAVSDGGRILAFGYMWRILLATLLGWLVSRMLNQVMMGESLFPPPAVEGIGQVEYLLLLFLSSLLVTATMVYAAALSSLRGLALVQVLAIAHFGLHHLLTTVEATVFLPRITASEVGLGMFSGAIESAVLAVCVAAALGKIGGKEECDASTPEPMPGWEWLWKFTLCSFAYLVLYMVAGALILPFVRQYYPNLEDTRGMEPAFIFCLQLRRGAVYVACLVPLIRSMRASRWQIALATALFVPIVHGVAGLLVPNEHMAATAWRFAHIIEIGWSTFLFGLLIGYLFSRGLPVNAVEHAEPAHRCH